MSDEAVFCLGDRIYTESKVWRLAAEAYREYWSYAGVVKFSELPPFEQLPLAMRKGWFAAATTVVVISDSIGVIE